MKWRKQQDTYKEAIQYIFNRCKGIEKSFKTPWNKFNDAGVDGIEWNNIVVIGGRSGAGKTLIKDQIIREAHNLNPEERIDILEFQLEMVARAGKVREFSSVLGKSYKYVCSTKNQKLSVEDYNKLVEYSKKQLSINHNIDVVENAPTVSEFAEIVKEYMYSNANMDDEGNIKSFNKTIITLDHSILIRTTGNQGKTEMLYDLGECLTDLKKQYPIIFIILSQLGRGVESPERNENGKYGNYITANDLFGADALFQHADMVIGINRPAMKNITLYGPEKYHIDDDETLVFHFLKCRNGDTRMSFFRAEFDKMRISEMQTPQKG